MSTSEKRIDYWQIADIGNYYLEDSFVEHIVQDKHRLVFTLLAVLRESHPDYSTPAINEQYCYRKAKLEFRRLRDCQWIKLNIVPVTDREGNVDLGSIDVLFMSKGKYYIEGEWGSAIIESSSPVVVLVSNE